MRVNGKVVLITGASQGIGKAAALRFAEAGAHVLLVARTATALEELSSVIRSRGGHATSYSADVASHEAVGEMAGRILADIGVPDVLLNNAGSGRWGPIEETSADEFIELMGVPYFGACFVTRSFIEGMLVRGSGQVVLVNSAASRIAWPGSVGYAAARFALRGFAEALRADLHGTGVAVTEFVASKVRSNYFKNNPGAEERISQNPMMLPTLSSEQAAKALHRAVEQEKKVAYAPLPYRVLARQAQLLPGLSSWVTVKSGSTQKKRRALGSDTAV